MVFYELMIFFVRDNDKVAYSDYSPNIGLNLRQGGKIRCHCFFSPVTGAKILKRVNTITLYMMVSSLTLPLAVINGPQANASAFI